MSALERGYGLTSDIARGPESAQRRSVCACVMEGALTDPIVPWRRRSLRRQPVTLPELKGHAGRETVKPKTSRTTKIIRSASNSAPATSADTLDRLATPDRPAVIDSTRNKSTHLEIAIAVPPT